LNNFIQVRRGVENLHGQKIVPAGGGQIVRDLAASIRCFDAVSLAVIAARSTIGEFHIITFGKSDQHVFHIAWVLSRLWRD